LLLRAPTCLYVCLFVCLSVCLYACVSRKPRPNFTIFAVHVTRGRGSVLLDGIEIHYVLPVSWMTTFSRNRESERILQRRVRFVEFAMCWHRGEVCRLRLHLVQIRERTDRQTNKEADTHIYRHADCRFAVLCTPTGSEVSTRLYAADIFRQRDNLRTG